MGGQKMEKMIVIILIVLAVSVLLISGCEPKVKEGAWHKTNATPDEGAKWETFGSTSDGSWFYDGTRITRPSKDVVRVWAKLVWSDKGRVDNVKEYGEKFRTLDYTLALIEIHCGDKRIRALSQSAYSTNRDLLSSFDRENAFWNFMSPDSVMDHLRKAICK